MRLLKIECSVFFLNFILTIAADFKNEVVILLSHMQIVVNGFYSCR